MIVDFQTNINDQSQQPTSPQANKRPLSTILTETDIESVNHLTITQMQILTIIC